MNKIFLSLAVFTLSLAGALPAASYAQSARESIAIVVNQGAVTASDIDGRIKLIMASSGMPNTNEVKEKIRPQIINVLVDESLMMQEAKRLGITVTPEEIEKGFATLAQQNNFTPDQFRTILKRQGIPFKALSSQIAAQLAWSKVIQKEVRPQINITENQVDGAMARLQANQGAQEYLISEIFLPVDSPQQEGEVRQLSERLTQQLSGGKAPFPGVARQFSQSASAAKGGDVGWVEATQLPEEVANALSQMQEGQLSRPVRSLSGYHILMLRKQRVITAETIPSREEVLHRMGMEQLDRAQRRYLLDLKSSAFIERRV